MIVAPAPGQEVELTYMFGRHLCRRCLCCCCLLYLQLQDPELQQLVLVSDVLDLVPQTQLLTIHLTQLQSVAKKTTGS